MKYTNDKYSANTTSIFVPLQYKPQIEQIIEWQNTQQDPARGEFICAIETAFSFSCADEPEQYDMLLVTIQESVYKRVARQLFDTDTLLALLLDTQNPVEDDDVYIKSACEKQSRNNIWFNRNWLLPVPIEVHWAADFICDQYEGFILTSIKPEPSGTYTAWYIDTTAHPEEDWYIMCREFQMIDNKAVDLYDVR